MVVLHKAGSHLALRLVEELGYRRRFFDDEMIERAKRDDARDFLDAMAPDAAYFLHECRIDRYPPDLLEHWREHGDPIYVYQFRDPRAVLLSQVNYLRRSHRGKCFSNVPYHLVFSDVLRARPSERDALDVALHCMGDYLRESFLGSVWMLHHPRVLTLRYERLVGPDGGGDRVQQVDEVARVLRHLDVDAPCEAIARRLYDPAQRTFHRGSADAWKDVYTPAQLRLFEQRHGDLLDIYGYPRADRAARA